MTKSGAAPRLDQLDLIVYDFDGVMTDNRALVSEDGREAVFCHRGDGMAIAALRKRGLRQIIISTEANPVVSARAGKLNIPVIQGVDDKATTLTSYAAEIGADLNKTAYVGNDTNDLEAMRLVGFPIAPADAHPVILALACAVTRAKGGEGVLREFLDILTGPGGAV